MPEHGVDLFQRFDAGFHCLNGEAHGVCQSFDGRLILRYKFMQRRIEETDGHRQAFHRFENADKVIALVGKDFRQCLFPALFVASKDHLTHSVNAVTLKEHVLSTGQTNTLSAKVQSGLGVLGCVCVGSDSQCSILIGPGHERSEVAAHLSFNHRYLTDDYFTGCTVQRNPVPFFQDGTAECESLICFTDLSSGTAGYTALTHTTGNYRSVGGHAAPGSEDTLSNVHTANVLWRCLVADKDNGFAPLGPYFCFLSRKHNAASSSTRRSGQARGDCFVFNVRIDHGMEKLV